MLTIIIDIFYIKFWNACAYFEHFKSKKNLQYITSQYIRRSEYTRRCAPRKFRSTSLLNYVLSPWHNIEKGTTYVPGMYVEYLENLFSDSTVSILQKITLKTLNFLNRGPSH